MSPSLPLLPEPMVKIWPSSSLQAPTSDAFLGMVALAPLPRPPRPRPALPLVLPRPPWPALGVPAIIFVSKGPTDSRTMAVACGTLGEVTVTWGTLGFLRVLRSTRRKYLFLAFRRSGRVTSLADACLGQQIPPAALFLRPMDLARHSCTCGSVRCLRTRSVGWFVSSRRISTND